MGLGAQQPGGTVQPAHEQEGERFLGTPQCRTEQPVRSEDMRHAQLKKYREARNRLSHLSTLNFDEIQQLCM